MLKKLISVILLLMPSVAMAQSNPGVTVSGAVTSGHCASFLNGFAIQDAGQACGSGSSGISIGTTSVSGGSSGYVLYNNSGVVGNTSYIQIGTASAPVTITAPLDIGTPAITDTGILAQLTSSVAGYNQFVIQNTNSGSSASANYIVNNNLGTSSTYYGEFGMNSSNFTGSGNFNLANAVYLDSQNGDLALGTLTANSIHFIVNGNSVTTDAMTIGTTGVATFANTIIGSINGNAATVTTNANLTGDVTSVGNATTIGSSVVTGKQITGYVSGAGTISATDTILTAINKLNGNIGALVTGVSSVTGDMTLFSNSASTGAVTLTPTSQSANIVIGTTAAGAVKPLAVPSCSSASNALQWTSGTGFGCNSSITANAVPAANLTGTTLASGVTASSLTSVGTLGSLLVSGTVGIGTTTVANKIDINGAASIGYVNTAAPSNGLLVSGNVGIGSSAPAYTLDVSGVIHGTSDLFLTKGGSPFIGTNNTQDLRLGTNSTEYMRIANSGNVGIGSSSPRSLLDVAGSVYSTGLTVAPAVNTNAITITGNTDTTSNQLLNITSTWNNASTTFDAPIFENVTVTAAGANSLLMDLQASSSTVFSVKKNGNITASGTIASSLSGTAFSMTNTGGTIAWTDTTISRKSAGVVQIGTTIANALGTLYSGSAGIGTTSLNGYNLGVVQAGYQQGYFASSGSNAANIVIDNQAGSQGSNLNLWNAGVNKFDVSVNSSNNFTIYDNANSKTAVSIGTTGVVTLGENSTVTIGSSSNIVGIGSSSPQTTLDVNGDIAMETGTTGAMLCLTSAHLLGHCSGGASCLTTCTCTCVAN